MELRSLLMKQVQKTDRTIVKKMSNKSSGEQHFAQLCRTLKMPEPQREHKFHPTRRWRFDFAWPEKKVAVEIEGGVYIDGRHTRGKGYERDLEKYNAAVADGWKVFRFTPGMLRKDPAGCMAQVKIAIKTEMEE